MNQENRKHERDEQQYSQENAKKMKKVVRRTDEEVLEMLVSWRENADRNDSELQKPSTSNVVHPEVASLANVPETEVHNRKVYTVIYGKHKPYKKHKTFEFDGTLIVSGLSATLKDCNDQVVSRCSEYKNNELRKLDDGTHLIVGDQLCEICCLDN